jgi:hypothetical protein
MPGLMACRTEFGASQPFKGAKIAGVHPSHNFCTLWIPGRLHVVKQSDCLKMISCHISYHDINATLFFVLVVIPICLNVRLVQDHCI